MAKNRFWQGVRMRRTWAAADPDAPPRQVTVPAAWDEAAASALAALLPGGGALALAAAAEAWIEPLERAEPALGEALRRLLLARRGAPGPGIWADGPEAAPGFVLNLPAFHDPQAGLDVAALAEATRLAATALCLARPDAECLMVSFADLAGLLAACGIDYDSGSGREVAACIAGLVRGMTDRTVAERRGSAGRHGPPLPPLPARCAIPGLAEAARQHARPPQPLLAATTGITTAGPVAALLGVETGGIAPAYSPLAANGQLSRAAVLGLAARGLSPEAALAAVYRGADPLPVPGVAAHQAMHDAVAPFLHAMPPRPSPLPAPAMHTAEQPVRRELPARRRGYTQRASVGGHRVYISTGEYADGSLGEINVALPKDGPVVRGLMDCFTQAVSLGLQHGVGLAAFVETFVGTRFGPAGDVEGDAGVTRAASLVDYVMRSLAASYLAEQDLPAAEPDPVPPAADPAPLLPLDLPRERRLRLVSNRKGD